MPSFTNIGPAVSEPLGFENVDTAWTDGRTFDQFYNSSRDRRLKTSETCLTQYFYRPDVLHDVQTMALKHEKGNYNHNYYLIIKYTITAHARVATKFLNCLHTKPLNLTRHKCTQLTTEMLVPCWAAIGRRHTTDKNELRLDIRPRSVVDVQLYTSPPTAAFYTCNTTDSKQQTGQQQSQADNKLTLIR